MGICRFINDTIIFKKIKKLINYSQYSRTKRYNLDDTIPMIGDKRGRCLKSSKKPITGIVFEKDEMGRLMFEGMYQEGNEQGLHKFTCTRWLDTDGSVMYAKKKGDKAPGGSGKGRWEFYTVEENYKNGKLHALSKKWYSGGNLEDEVNYNKGYKDGCHKYYYENGQLSAEEYYKGGGKFNLDFFGECYGSYYNGTSKYWDENGQLFREHNYKDNQLISGRCWDETGIEIDYFSIDLDDIDYKGLADAYWEDVDDIIKKSD